MQGRCGAVDRKTVVIDVVAFPSSPKRNADHSMTRIDSLARGYLIGL